MAKGSFGTVLKVLDCGLGALLAVKVKAFIAFPSSDSPIQGEGTVGGGGFRCLFASAIPLQVVPKVEVLQQDSLRQCKEEVSIQVSTEHPRKTQLRDRGRTLALGGLPPGPTWIGEALLAVCSYTSS